jgi:crossover junction endodeoxyribonuclease RuvC
MFAKCGGYQPDRASVEIVFVNVNPQATLLGQARCPHHRAGILYLPVAEAHRAADEKPAGHGGRQGPGCRKWCDAPVHRPAGRGRRFIALGLAVITHAHAGTQPRC